MTQPQWKLAILFLGLGVLARVGRAQDQVPVLEIQGRRKVQVLQKRASLIQVLETRGLPDGRQGTIEDWVPRRYSHRDLNRQKDMLSLSSDELKDTTLEVQAGPQSLRVRQKVVYGCLLQDSGDQLDLASFWSQSEGWKELPQPLQGVFPVDDSEFQAEKEVEFAMDSIRSHLRGIGRSDWAEGLSEKWQVSFPARKVLWRFEVQSGSAWKPFLEVEVEIYDGC